MTISLTRGSDKGQDIKSLNKTVIVINGTGGVGKTTLVEMVSREIRVVNISSITPAKRVAMNAGWDGEINARGRAFLVDIHQALIKYDDLPYKYLLNCYRDFIISDNEIMFVHIREPENIDRFKQSIIRRGGSCVALLITKDGAKAWGNTADDNVIAYKYDFIFDNSKPLSESAADFVKLVQQIQGWTHPLGSTAALH